MTIDVDLGCEFKVVLFVFGRFFPDSQLLHWWFIAILLSQRPSFEVSSDRPKQSRASSSYPFITNDRFPFAFDVEYDGVSSLLVMQWTVTIG